MIVREVDIGKTNEEKRDAIKKNLGREVILCDLHEEWCHGTLLKERHDKEVYQMKIEDGRKEKQLHYHDLVQLLVLNKRY